MEVSLQSSLMRCASQFQEVALNAVLLSLGKSAPACLNIADFGWCAPFSSAGIYCCCFHAVVPTAALQWS